MLRMELLNNIASSPDPLHQVDLVYKRPLSYSKMETLIKEMQDEETGVPVRSQKVFLASIPAAFAGYDIIEWLMERLNIEDSGEAIHLANLLCQHGYFFPVGTNNNPQSNFSVKDDSSLYRFQTPYYWPNRTSLSNSMETSVDYAIYLSKRALRNKQKHALEDYEVEALHDLKRCLGNKWDFVQMQADEQVRLSKDKKKLDKLVLDSQERAHWRVLRPPIGMPCCTETPPTFNTQSTQKVIRKTNHLVLEDLRNEVELLRNSCIRTRIKASCALESLSSHCESYHEHDPFLTARQPSNPWHSDDPTYWALNADNVEIPVERRLKKWAISMEDLVFDPAAGLREFTAYLKKEYCNENIRFWLAVRDMKYGPVSTLRAKAQQIYNEFLSPGSPCEINIDMRTMDAVQKELNFLVPSRFTFDPAAEHVYIMLLKKDCYPRFIRSEHYKNLLAQSQQITIKNNTKRLDKFFSFVVERKKKTSTTDDHKIKLADLNSLQHQETLSTLTDNCPYRGDLDNNPQLSQQNSLDDVCCPWETSSSVKSDKTTSTDKIHRIEPVKQVSDKSDKVLKQKSLEEQKASTPKSEEKLAKKDESVKPQKTFVQLDLSSMLPNPPTFPLQEQQPQLKRQLSKQSSNASRKSLEIVKEIEAEEPKMIQPVATTSPVASTSAACLAALNSMLASPIASTVTEENQEEVEEEEQRSKPESEKSLPPQQPVPEPVVETTQQPQQEKAALKKQISRKKSTASSTSSAELINICPWDAENGSAPEQSTFTKTYSTLGYL